MSTPPTPTPTPAEQTPLALGQRLGHSNQFTIARLLGRGGFGEVYLAIEGRVDRSVAIKVMRPEFNGNNKMLRRFKGEYALGTHLSHPSLVQMFDLAETAEGIHYIVMEYIDGVPLSTRMAEAERKDGQLGIEAAYHLGWQIGSLFAQLHERNITHRDLKPGNIMVVKDPTIHGGERYKLLDFGIAKLNDADRAKRLNVDFNTSAGVLLGTIALMDPETFNPGGSQGPAGDVYALGCMLYRCIAGNYPFTGETELEVITQHRSAEPIPLTAEDPTTPQDVADLIHRMLAKTAAGRPTMAEVAPFFAYKLGLASAAAGQMVVRGGTQELQAVIADAATDARSATGRADVIVMSADGPSVQGGQQMPAPHSTDARRRRRIALGIGLGAAALLAAGLVAMRSVSAPPVRQTAFVPASTAQPVAPPSTNVPDLGTVDTSQSSKPATVITTIDSDKRAPVPDKKRKKKKNARLYHD